MGQGSGSVGLDEGLCVGTDKDDNVLISGSFTGQAVFDTVVVNGFAGDEIFIVKYNALGGFNGCALPVARAMKKARASQPTSTGMCG
jgi:hypothetical protein